jgi:hypothetical protein
MSASDRVVSSKPGVSTRTTVFVSLYLKLYIWVSIVPCSSDTRISHGFDDRRRLVNLLDSKPCPTFTSWSANKDMKVLFPEPVTPMRITTTASSLYRAVSGDSTTSRIIEVNTRLSRDSRLGICVRNCHRRTRTRTGSTLVGQCLGIGCSDMVFGFRIAERLLMTRLLRLRRLPL